MQTRQLAFFIFVIVASAFCSGCCWRGKTLCTRCPEFMSERGPMVVSVKSADAGVTTNFGSLPDYESARQSLLAQVATDGTVAITLEEVLCLAAKNSELADVIDQERHLLKCRIDQMSSPDRCSHNCQSRQGIDIVLHGEALEQRNLAAGKAAEAFFGLVQISLQLELLEESKVRLAELEATVQAADEAGFATAKGADKVKRGQLKINRMQSSLEAAHQQLTYQLNMLINACDGEVVVFQPVFDVNPQQVSLNVLEETALAEENRPGIIATKSAAQLSCDSEGLYRLLNMFDARLGSQLQAKPVRKLLLRRQLTELMKTIEAPDPTTGNRQRQVSKIVELRKREARLATAKAMLDMQTAFEKLTIAHADVQRLKEQAEVLEASKDVDAKDAYLKQSENWVGLQEARSIRIQAAIEFEIARVKMKQAQGLLAKKCGYGLEFCGCR